MALNSMSMLVGLPGSGKSYHAERLVNTGFSLHSSDAILEDIAKDAGLTYNDVFKDNIKIADQLFWQELQKAIDNNENIIVDRTNLTVKSRSRIIEMAKDKYTITAKVFETPFHDGKKWKEFLAAREGKIIPSNVIGSMMFNYECPTLDEGFVCVEITKYF